MIKGARCAAATRRGGTVPAKLMASDKLGSVLA